MGETRGELEGEWLERVSEEDEEFFDVSSEPADVGKGESAFCVGGCDSCGGGCDSCGGGSDSCGDGGDSCGGGSDSCGDGGDSCGGGCFCLPGLGETVGLIDRAVGGVLTGSLTRRVLANTTGGGGFFMTVSLCIFLSDGGLHTGLGLVPTGNRHGKVN